MKELIPAFAKIPTIYWSSPGQCKTSTIEHVASQLGYHCETLVLSQCDPADIGGIPSIKDGKTSYAEPDWLDRLRSAPKSILFFDELTTARPSVQAPALTLIQSRKIHSFKLPESTLIIAASNPPEEAADGSDLEPPMANRFCHLNWKVDLNTWVDKLLSDFKSNNFYELPGGWENLVQEERGMIASFLKSKPALANALPQSREEQGRAWPSYRTWTNAATILAACKSVNQDPLDFVSGCVGEGAAIEYFNWRKNLDLPDPEKVLSTVNSFIGGWTVPKRDDVTLAIINSVCSAIKQNNTLERWNLGWDVMNKIADKGKQDLAVVGARMLRDCNQGYNLPKNWDKIKEFADKLK